MTAIIITNQGHVENKIFELQENMSIDDLVACVNMMNELLGGHTINQVVSRLERDVKPVLALKIREHEAVFNAL